MIRLFALVALATSVAFAAQDPSALVKAKDVELQNYLKKKNRDAKDNESIKHLINDIFDFEVLAKKSVPAATWKGLDDATRAEFVKNFKRMVENSSVKKLEVYKSDSSRYEPAVTKGDGSQVTSHIYNKGKETVLVYKFEQPKDGNWKAWDLVIDDLSTARNYRDQFTKILETKTFKDLMDIVKKKADES